MEDRNMETLWTIAAPAWQWIVGTVVALYVWEMYLEHVWYKFKHWVLNEPHKNK